MKTQTKKSLKPIEADIHFKYRCKNSDCGCEHWLSLRETQTKNFKIVCYCGLILKPKKIKNIKVCYEKSKQAPDSISLNIETTDVSQKIPVELQEKSVKLLTGYGFSHDESVLLTEKAYNKNPINNLGKFIKYIITNLGELDEHN